jgi:hypothetical protein
VHGLFEPVPSVAADRQAVQDVCVRLVERDGAAQMRLGLLGLPLGQRDQPEQPDGIRRLR